jgi:hypothetical protein
MTFPRCIAYDSVRENRLMRAVVSEFDYMAAIESTGRGWVIESDACVIGVAVPNRTNGNVWALSVDPDYEKLG